MHKLQDITGMISVLVQLVQTMKRLDLPTRQEKEEFLLHIEVFFRAQNHVLATFHTSQPKSLNMCNKQIKFAGFYTKMFHDLYTTCRLRFIFYPHFYARSVHFGKLKLQDRASTSHTGSLPLIMLVATTYSRLM